MNKFFQEPEITIEKFAAEEVITTSWTAGDNEGEGDPL